MVEMNMRQENIGDVGQSDAAARELALEDRKARRRTGIDEGDAARRLHDAGGDGMTAAEELEVDGKTGRKRVWARGLVPGIILVGLFTWVCPLRLPCSRRWPASWRNRAAFATW
jgi:hypothetical protein